MSETIKRVSDHTKGFTIMVNEALVRSDLSARAKGLYAYLMTLPDDWTIRKPELYSHFTEGREAMETAFKELSAAGYVDTVEIRTGGRFAEYRHTIHESATAPQKTVNGLPLTGKPLTENPTLLSTDLPSTEKQSTTAHHRESGKEPKHKHGEFQHVLLTTSELDKLKTDFPLDWKDRITRLDEYIEMKGAKYRNHNLTIRNWAKRDREKDKSNQTRLNRLPEDDPILALVRRNHA